MPRKQKINTEIISFLDKKLKHHEEGMIIEFADYLLKIQDNPKRMLRNIFQLFHDMIYSNIEILEDITNDPESINYKTIKCEKLFEKNTDTPFFADLPLANRLVRLADSFKEGIKQNKIYVFIGPPGSGKSTFLNNLLRKFEEFTHTDEGINYEVLWRIDRNKISENITERLSALGQIKDKKENEELVPDILEVPCPSHDHPFLLIPKEFRADVLEKLVQGNEKLKLFYKKEYEWIFKENPCTICSSIYETLLSRVKTPSEVFNMLFAKRYFFNRRLGDSISVFNPGDQFPAKFVIQNEEIQRNLGKFFKDSNKIQYLYSRYAKTNNGVFALMDVKGNNEKRLLDLHGVISEGVHKIEDIEENVKSLFIAVMNPEDKEKIVNIQSLKDRITEIKINYILNYTEEVKIYYHSFGKQIIKHFLPGVLENFAKIIISSRLHSSSSVLKEWIKDPKVYKKYCDEDLLLLKMELYTNIIPSWLSDEDKKSLTRNIRRRLINESESEGRIGFSGRESINIFNEFYSTYKQKNSSYKPITMVDIKEFFNKNQKYMDKIPKGFIDSLIRLYNYNVMQEIKEAMFKHNEERVSKDIQNYLFASNYDIGEKLTSPYTNEVVEVNESFFESIEKHLLEETASFDKKKRFRKEVGNKFTLELQKIFTGEEEITKTDVYQELYNTYMNNLRENIFKPLIKNTTFENAIKMYGTEKFDIYDDRTKEEVEYLIQNLIKKFNYTLEGARQVCLYIITNNIADSFES